MNLEHAKEQFEKYLDNYDREDDKVRLKIIHTYGVTKCSKEIAERMCLSREDIELAQLIGLLHDIGRFEQIKRFDSFEPNTMDHAAFGVEILFEEGMIREFVEEDTWDDIIRTAIAQHSGFEITGVTDERKLLHARIIRDADKLDNCRVKLEDAIETILGESAEEVGASAISDEVMGQTENHSSIKSDTRKTKMDYWVSYLVYFYDINYPVSFDIIKENDYLRKLVSRIPYSHPETVKKMERIENELERFIEQHCKNNVSR